MENINMSYRESHKGINKGCSYDKYYETNPWTKFLWEREQIIINNLLNYFYNDLDINYLDFACGTGRITSIIENRTKTSLGVDVSRSMLKIAKEKLQNTKLIECDLTKSNTLEGNRFNLITAFRFFLNAENDLRNKALEVISNLLSDDGYFIFNNHANWSSPSIKLKYYYGKIKNKDPLRVLSHSEIEKLLRSHNLKLVKIYPIGFINPIKFTLPNGWNHRIDSFIYSIKMFNKFSESPIFIAKYNQLSLKQ